MEVKLIKAEGAVEDEGCIISLRASSLRRQGKPQLRVPLCFPVALKEASPFKVDVLRQVGVGQVSVPPEGGDVEVCVLPQNKKSEMHERRMALKLRVTGLPQLCGRSRQELKTGSHETGADQDAVAQRASTGDHTSKAASKHGVTTGKDESEDPLNLIQLGATVQARQYFDDHNVMRVVQSLLEALIHDQPAEPFEFISAFMDALSVERRKLVEDGLSVEANGQNNANRIRNEVARQSVIECGCAAWVSAFEAVDTANAGQINAQSFCKAIQAVHPHLSLAQAQALCRGVAPAGAAGIDLAVFCGAATAAAAGDAMAAEVAGISAEDFADLGSKAECSSADASVERMRADMCNKLMEATRSGKFEMALQQSKPTSGSRESEK